MHTRFPRERRMRAPAHERTLTTPSVIERGVAGWGGVAEHPEARSATLTSRRSFSFFRYRLVAKGIKRKESLAPPCAGSTRSSLCKHRARRPGLRTVTPRVPAFVPVRQTGRGALSRAWRSLAPPTSHLPSGRAPRHTNARQSGRVQASVAPDVGPSPTHGTHTRACAGPVPVGVGTRRDAVKRRL